MARRRNWNPDPAQVIVVAGGRVARRQALEAGVYCCQNRRGFRPSKWMAFYANGAVDVLAEIDGVPEDDVVPAMRPALADLLADEMQTLYVMRTVFRLGRVTKIAPIKNDKVDKNGTRTAWTQSQRYTTLAKLKRARVTSQL